MNEQMHESIIFLPLDLLHSAQFLFSESVSPGRRTVCVGHGGRSSGKALRRGEQAAIPILELSSCSGNRVGHLLGQKLFSC